MSNHLAVELLWNVNLYIHVHRCTATKLLQSIMLFHIVLTDVALLFVKNTFFNAYLVYISTSFVAQKVEEQSIKRYVELTNKRTLSQWLHQNRDHLPPINTLWLSHVELKCPYWFIGRHRTGHDGTVNHFENPIVMVSLYGGKLLARWCYDCTPTYRMCLN
jgi:hypothetical protein